MLVKDDEEEPQKMNALMESAFSYEEVKEEEDADDGLQAAEDRKFSIESRPSKQRRMTVSQAQ